MEKKIKVDIILCDFDLGNIKGNLALEKITEAEKINTIRWYKVLHSIGSEYQEFQNDKIVDFTFDSKNRDAIHNVILKTFENKILTPILYGNPIQFENYYTGSNEINFKRMNKEMYNDILFERILCVHSTQFSENYKIIYLGEDYSIQESTTYVALSNLKMLYFHKVDKSLYINKLWIADYNIQKNCVKFIRNGNQQFVININEVLKKKKHVPNILSYFNSLLSSQKPEIFVEPKSLQRYFHFS